MRRRMEQRVRMYAQIPGPSSHAEIFFINIFLGDYFSYYIQHCFFCRPSDSTVPTEARIEPRTVATALAVRRSKLDLIS